MTGQEERDWRAGPPPVRDAMVVRIARDVLGPSGGPFVLDGRVVVLLPEEGEQ